MEPYLVTRAEHFFEEVLVLVINTNAHTGKNAKSP
jgi:hypothetical protein